MGTTKSAEPSHLIIASMLANPAITQQQIADTLGVCISTVSKVKRILANAVEDRGIAKNAYRMLLNEHVPVSDRVGVIKTAVTRAKTNPFAALKAVEYADMIDGVHPKLEQQQEIQDNTRPMFTLPPGTKVQMSITTPDIIEVGQDEDPLPPLGA